MQTDSYDIVIIGSGAGGGTMARALAPTGRRIEAPTVAIVQFRDGRIESEHIYWDQASVLVQIGLLEAGGLPVAGVETAAKLRDPERPSNALIARATGRGQAQA